MSFFFTYLNFERLKLSKEKEGSLKFGVDRFFQPSSESHKLSMMMEKVEGSPIPSSKPEKKEPSFLFLRFIFSHFCDRGKKVELMAENVFLGQKWEIIFPIRCAEFGIRASNMNIAYFLHRVFIPPSNAKKQHTTFLESRGKKTHKVFFSTLAGGKKVLPGIIRLQSHFITSD